MSFLDRFKPQPRWKHADAAVRAAAAVEIPDDAEHEATILGGRVMEPGPMPEAPPWIRLVAREPAA